MDLPSAPLMFGEAHSAIKVGMAVQASLILTPPTSRPLSSIEKL